MRIGLNALYVAPGLAGGTVYFGGLLRGLAAIDSDDEYLVYTRRGIAMPELPPERFRQVQAPVPASSTLRRTLWEYCLLPHRARTDGLSVFHGLGSLSPAIRSTPFVLTIHDLIYRRFPQSVPFGYRNFMEWVLPRVAPQADRVIVPSRYTAQEAAELLKVPEQRIRVVPYGAGQDFRPVTDPESIRNAMERLGIRQPYIVSVARAYPHKNLAGLLRAFARLHHIGHRELQLALVGDQYGSAHSLNGLARSLGVDQHVVFTGFASQEDLNILYSAASVFAFPSLAEGLGLPVLEAMACGAPVVASNATAIPEAVGTAGILADASDPNAFATAMAAVYEDVALQEKLRVSGLEQARRFSWKQCASATLSVYKEIHP